MPANQDSSVRPQPNSRPGSAGGKAKREMRRKKEDGLTRSDLQELQAFLASTNAGRSSRASHAVKSQRAGGGLPSVIREESEEEAREPTDEELMAAHMLKMTSSSVFSKVMHDLQMKRVQHERERAAILKERQLAAQQKASENTADQPMQLEEVPEEVADFYSDEDSEDEPADSAETEATARRIRAAERGWAKIRRHVREQAMARKHTGAAMSWSFLRQTISNMTDMEKTRNDLYEKYLNKPNQWMEGFQNFPKEVLLSSRRSDSSKPGNPRNDNRSPDPVKTPRTVPGQHKDRKKVK